MKFSILLVCCLLVGCHHNVTTNVTIKLTPPDGWGEVNLTTTID
jgi:hypothetical protein